MKINPEDIRLTPYPLPEAFEWYTLDLNSESDLITITEFMKKNYFDDPRTPFRLCYSEGFLKWILTLPNGAKDWMIGVRVRKNKLLVGLITAIPSKISIEGKIIRMAVPGFLCVHTKLRGKRLTPVLIKELKRRVATNKIYQAAYTIPKLLPTPISQSSYWFRVLNFKRMRDVPYSSKEQAGFVVADTEVSLKLQEKASKLPNVEIKGLRKMTSDDINQVNTLLKKYLKKFPIHLSFSQEETRHMFLPKEDIVESYVVEDKEITDFISFYVGRFKSANTGDEYKVICYMNYRELIYFIMLIV